MCGIVAYFGGAGNGLTRVITAMSAIIYRAPDSTGVGLFGDDLEPIRIRKSLGSVANLCEALMNAAAYPNQPEKLFSLWSGNRRLPPEMAQKDDLRPDLRPDLRSDHRPDHRFDLREVQRRILEFENLPFDLHQKRSLDLEKGEQPYPEFSELLDPEKEIAIDPGCPGRPDPLPIYTIRSRRDMERVIRDLTVRYDLSYIAIRSIIRSALKERLAAEGAEKGMAIRAADILEAFDRLFEKVFLQENRPKPVRLTYDWEQKAPFAEKYLWRHLSRIPIRVPEDYDTDGIRSIFRLMDAALMCRLPLVPERHEALQQTFEKLWPESVHIPNTDWRMLYWAEKGANLYGRAAAAVFEYLKKTECPGLEPNPQSPPGRLDPKHLTFFTPPILSHGRWALQSAVTVTNAHPFLDGPGHRVISLNGQFDSEVEAEAREFLEKVEGFNLRSENSSEYLAILWGYYFENLRQEKHRYDAIHQQMEAGLSVFNIGSQTVDFQVYRTLQEKNLAELDEYAFLEAAKRMVRKGGQIAAAGMSLHAPRTLYVVSHNRPVFIVCRKDAEAYMVVSDINAALGLFPQSRIHDKTLELTRLRKKHDQKIEEIRNGGGSRKERDRCRRDQEAGEKRFMDEAFPVTVYPLEGEEIYARLVTELDRGEIRRTLRITDFSLNPLPEIKPFPASLTPAWVRKDLVGSFYETHMKEIPDRIDTVLNFYLPPERERPGLALRERLMERRFGRKLVNLRRVVVAGMGSAWHAGLCAKPLLQQLLPEILIDVIRPVEIDDISRFIVTEKDLVVLLSWSSTTADMVEFAKELKKQGAVMIAVTEKVFADMALIASRSGGVIPVYSGEEVTVSALKSTACLLLCTHLLGVWLADVTGSPGAPDRIRELRELPPLLGESLEDQRRAFFIRNLADESRESHACIVFDNLHAGETGREIALKMEERAWSAIGKVLDYSDLYRIEPAPDLGKTLVIVNATSETRISEAIRLMKRLYLSEIPFAAVSLDHPRINEIAFFSNNRVLTLPNGQDALQPYIDLLFYYDLAFHYGLAHGRNADDFPRNRAKSVTTSRSRTRKPPPPEKAWYALRGTVGQKLPKPALTDLPSRWEKEAAGEIEKKTCEQMRRLSRLLAGNDLLLTRIPFRIQEGREKEEKAGHKLPGKKIAEQLSSEGEILLLPWDRTAEIAARYAENIWRRYLDCNIRVLSSEADYRGITSENLLIALRSDSSDSNKDDDAEAIPVISGIGIGPSRFSQWAKPFRSSFGYIETREGLESVQVPLLYGTLCALFIEALWISAPDNARIARDHLAGAYALIEKITESGPLKAEIDGAMLENSRYETAFYLGGIRGAGSEWEERMDRAGGMTVAAHPFGQSAHGPLVTVDDRVEGRFVQLRARAEMVSAYGEAAVSEWERHFLSGKGVDDFLGRAGFESGQTDRQIPLFASGGWYIPVIEKDYDTGADNLIIIDGTDPRHFDATLDELSTYGCRHARMILLTQSAMIREERAFAKHPVSRMIRLPELNRGPIPDLLLPFALSLCSTAMAAAACRVRGKEFLPVSRERIYERAFGPIGSELLCQGIDLLDLGGYLIESLKRLGPVVKSAAMEKRYSVRQIGGEKTSRYLLTRILEEKIEDSDEVAWEEPYGNTWKVLNHQVLGVWEVGEDTSLLMIPLAGEPREGLISLKARFISWNGEEPFSRQIERVVEALGKGMPPHPYIAPRYFKIAGRFYDEMHSICQWDDRILGLAALPVLFCKGSREIADLLARRVRKLTEIRKPDGSSISLEEGLDSLDALWPIFLDAKLKTDKKRWNALYEAIQLNL